MKNLNDNLLWAVRPEIRAQVEDMTEAGWDKDLALLFLEELLGAEKTYVLDDNE